METVQPIEIPAPAPGDTETVVTALETAAVFAAKGDASEALRWLKRAVDWSGESGDDGRVLLLARTAAELNLRVKASNAAASSVAPTAASSVAPANGASSPSQRPLPKPPRKGNLPSGEAPSARAEATPLPDSRPPLRTASNVASITAPSGRPPPPSSRRSSFPSPAPASNAPAPAANGANAPAPAANGANAPAPAARSSTTPVALARSSPAPGSSPRASSVPERAASSPPNESRGNPRFQSTPLSRPSRPVIPGGRTSISRQLATARMQSLPDESEITARGGPDPVVSAAISAALAGLAPAPAERSGPSALGPALRQAARVSVEKSAAEPGVFFVRVLEDGKAPPEGSVEAYIVLVDPNAPLLRSRG